MRKMVTCLLLMGIIMGILIIAEAENTTVVIPSSIQEIEEEAFMGDTSIKEVVIPENADVIGTKAFSGCSALEKVTINSRDAQIASDAFDQCPNIHLYVYKYSTGETFANEKGLTYTLIDGDGPAMMNLKSMVGQFSISASGLQGGDDRLIICMNDCSLPDLSAYHPIAIAQGGENTYFVQFSDDDNGETDINNCYSFLNDMLGNEVTVLQRDAVTYITNRGEDAGTVGQAGIMTWTNDDPMGFDEYSQYVHEHQSGSQVIAVVDAGVKQSSVYNSMLYSKNFNLVPDGQGVFYSGRNHGSYIASIIHDCVGDTNVKIMSVRVVDDNEETIPSIFGEGIRQAVEAGADIINISYVLPYSPYVEYELQEAAAKGVKIVIAAGNYNGSTNDFFPANADVDNNKIVVSGLEDTDRVWARTNTGPQVTYCAPAAGIRTSYANISEGTSFAAPMIASAYALVSLDTTHSTNDMIMSCKTDIGLNGKTDKSQAIGNGMPQLDKLCARAVTAITVENVPDVMKVGETVMLNYTVVPENATNRTISYTSDNDSAIQILNGNNGEWGEWTTVYLEANEGRQVESRTLYKSTTTSYGAWSAWSGYQLSPVSESDTVSVDVAPVWSWYYYPCPNCGFHMWAKNCNCATWAGGCGKYIADADLCSFYLPYDHNSGEWNFGGTGSNRVRLNDSTYGNGWIYGQENDHNAKVGYRYRNRSKNVSESEWQTAPITPVNTNDLIVAVEAKTEYRYQSITSGSNSGELVLHALDRGSSAITLSANDESGVTKRFVIPVVQPVTSIKINSDKTEIKTTQTLTLSVNVQPSNANNKQVTWKSSNTSIAEVSSTGIVTPISSGNVVIRAEAQDGYGAFDEITLSFIEIPDPESIDIIAHNTVLSEDDTLELAPGDKLRLVATVHPDGAVQDVVWSARSIPASTTVVTIDSETGYLTAVNEGAAYITATSTEKAAVYKLASVIVRVKPEGITISGDGEVKVGQTITLVATVMPENATNKNVVWESSNENATVSQNGMVTGVKSGEVIILARSAADSNVVEQKEILVKQMPESISISGNANIFINNDDPAHPAQNASQLTATVSPSDTYDKSVTWSSSNTSVATVSDSGLVTTVSPGSATITATSNADANIQATYIIIVKNKWSDWSTWSDTPVSGTVTRQIESRTIYRSTTTSYGGWSSWSGYQLSAVASSDTTNVESTSVWTWVYTPCPYCGFHMWANSCNCAGWAGGCGRWFGASDWIEILLPYDHNSGAWNFGGVGSNRVRLYDSTYGYGWIYGKESDHSAKVGYRYRTRSKNVTVSGWQTTPIEPRNTNDYIVEVEPKQQYRYRVKNTFDPQSVALQTGYDRVIADGDYIIATAKDSLYYLDIDGSDVPASNNTNVHLWKADSLNSIESKDVWTVSYNSTDKFYTIKQKGTNMCLDVSGDGLGYGKNVQVYSSSGPAASSNTSKWAISSNGSGYRLQSKGSGMSLDMRNGVTSKSNVWQATNEDSDYQRWVFIPYTP